MEPLRRSSEAALREFLKVTMVVAPSLTALPDDLTPLEAALRAWLSEFRAFVDVTSALLSEHYGEDGKARLCKAD